MIVLRVAIGLALMVWLAWLWVRLLVLASAGGYQRLGAGKNGGNGATPYSLEFATDHVSCGSDAAIDDLHAADFTFDLYFINGTGYADNTNYGILAKCSGAAGVETAGWCFFLRWTSTSATLRFNLVDGGATRRSLSRTSDKVEGNPFYLRARRSGNNIYLSLNAGAEGTTAIAAGGTSDAARYLAFGSATGNNRLIDGAVCYAHLWDVDKGALGAVPTSPFAVDGDTVARWTCSEGAGATLGDDAENADGTLGAGVTWAEEVPSGWSLGS